MVWPADGITEKRSHYWHPFGDIVNRRLYPDCLQEPGENVTVSPKYHLNSMNRVLMVVSYPMASLPTLSKHITTPLGIM